MRAEKGGRGEGRAADARTYRPQWTGGGRCASRPSARSRFVGYCAGGIVYLPAAARAVDGRGRRKEGARDQGGQNASRDEQSGVGEREQRNEGGRASSGRVPDTHVRHILLFRALPRERVRS